MKPQQLDEKESLTDFLKRWSSIRYSILAIIALGIAIQFAANNFSGDNPITLLPILVVIMPLYHVLKDRVILPLAIGSLMSVLLVGLIPQINF